MQARQILKIDWITGMISAGILLSVGRLIQSSLKAPSLLEIGISLSIIVVLFYFIHLASERFWSPHQALFALVAMTFCSLCFLLISASSDNVVGLFAWTGVALGLGVTGVIGLGAFGKPLRSKPKVTSNKLLSDEPETLEETLLANLNFQATETDESEDEIVLQSWTRTRSFSGAERLEGAIRICFSENQKIFNLHLPIYPAFSSLPSVWCETEDADLSTDVDTTQAYGVRIRIRRLDNPVEALETELHVVISTESNALADVA